VKEIGRLPRGDTWGEDVKVRESERYGTLGSESMVEQDVRERNWAVLRTSKRGKERAASEKAYKNQTAFLLDIGR